MSQKRKLIVTTDRKEKISFQDSDDEQHTATISTDDRLTVKRGEDVVAIFAASTWAYYIKKEDDDEGTGSSHE